MLQCFCLTNYLLSFANARKTDGVAVNKFKTSIREKREAEMTGLKILRLLKGVPGKIVICLPHQICCIATIGGGRLLDVRSCSLLFDHVGTILLRNAI